jgi:hypothetical protein
MLSQVDKQQALLALYRQERKDLEDPLDESPFPSFKEWCNQINAERQDGDYRTVTVAEAEEEMDAVLVEVDTNDLPTITQETSEMNQTTDGAQPSTEAASDATTAAPAASKAKRVRKPAAAKVAKPAKKQTKADLARSIFKRLSRGKVLNREKIIAAFVSEAKLSAKGAATYYQSLKGKGGKKAA